MNYSILDTMPLDSKIKILRYLAYGYDICEDMGEIELEIAESIVENRLIDPYFLPEGLNIRNDIKLHTTFSSPSRRKLGYLKKTREKFDFLRFLAFGYDYYGTMNSLHIALAKDTLKKRSENNEPRFLPKVHI